MVTHDIELIKSDSNLIYFYINENGTQSVNIAEIQKTQHCIRRIIDNIPSILFSAKCFFVEGYTDKMFFDVFLKKHKIYDYNIIDIGGNEVNIKTICSVLKLDYKILYDNDTAINFLMEESNKEKLDKDNKIINKCFKMSDFDKLERFKLDKTIFTYDVIKDICSLDGINLKNLPKFLVYVFIDTLKWFWKTDKLEITCNVNYNTNNKLNSSFNWKDVDIILKEIEMQRTNNTCSYTDFINEIKRNYEISKYIAEKIDPNRELPQLEKLISRINNFVKKINNNNDFLNLSKMIDEIIDERIYKLNGKVYIWNSSYNDIEGVMSKLCGKDFPKPEWKNTYRDDIEKYLNEYDKQYPDNEFLKEILNFFK
jgi:hypothetical protein